MNSFIETLNQWGGNFLNFAWPMLWQSSLLIAGLFTVDFLFRRKLRASIRYALWLVVLVKLCVPPTLALPTSPAWWLHRTPPPVVAKSLPHYTVTYDNGPLPEMPQTLLAAVVPPKPVMTNAAWLLVAATVVSSALLLWLLVRWWQITRLVRRAIASGRLALISEEAQQITGMKLKVQVKLTPNSMSPAVCGLFRPAILIPQSLAENFSDGQLRAVLLHELIHLLRRDVWLNFLQALLQIIYWWHPLLWLANARIRLVREEAVDDAVMLALRGEAEAYAPTLLAVAKLALNRPLVSLGLVGIMESRHALRERIERLVDFRAPRKAGLTLVSLLGILAFTAVAVPMGDGPAPATEVTTPHAAVSIPAESDQNSKSISVRVNYYLFPMRPVDFERTVSGLKFNDGGKRDSWWLASPGQFQQIFNDFSSLGIRPMASSSTAAALGQTVKAVTGNIHTSGIDLICTPTVLDDFINLTIEGMSSGRFAIEGKTNYFQAKIIARNHEGIVLRAANPGGYAESNLMVMLGVQLVTNLDTELITYGLGTIDKKTTLDNLRRATHLNCTTPEEKVNALHKLFTDAGVDLPKSGKAIYIGSSGGFRMNAARKYSAVIQSVMEKLKSGSLPATDSPLAIWAPVMDKLKSGPQSDSRPAVNAQNMNAPTTTVAGILTDPNFRVVIRALEQRNGAETLHEPEVITRSGGHGINRITADKISAPLAHPVAPVTNLFSRHFKVDANSFVTFVAALQKTPGLKTNDITTPARNFFSTLGVDLELPGKSIFYNDGRSELFVRATSQDLDTIENALEVLSRTAPQIHIKARFLEVLKGTLSGLQKSRGLTNTTEGTFVGILSSTNAQAILRVLSASKGSETLAKPEVLTSSGRQTQMRATVVQSIITNFEFEETVTNVDGVFVTNNVITPKVQQIESGPIVDVVPNVLVDGITIDLKTKASQTEFWGYATPPTNAPLNAVTNSAGEEIDLPLIWPAMQISRATANVSLHDGQTLLMALNPPEQIRFAEPDEKREAVVAKQIRDGQKKNKGGEREILVLITATLVDPAGNRVHADEEMPSAKDGIPPQSP